MKYLQIRSLIFILAITLIGVACDSNSDTTGPGSGEEPATVEGQVEGDNTQNKIKGTSSDHTTAAVEGAAVTALKINADGSTEAIADAETQTNAEGEFTLNINAEAVANSGQQIIVMAEKNSQQWKAFVSGELESGSTVKVQPLTVESSVEADVYSEVVAQNNTDIVSKADVEAFVGAETSAEIRSNAQAAATIAEALAAEAQARAEFFANQSAKISSDQKKQIMNAKAAAQAQLESELDAAASSAEEEAAMESFLKAVAEAHAEAGVDISAYAEAKELAGRVALKHCSSLSAETKTEIRTQTALLTSFFIDQAVQARMEAEEVAQSSIDAAADAAVTLRQEINVMVGASKAEIDAVFETYNQTVVDVLSQEFSANSETILSINSGINESSGLKATLETTVEATANTELIVDAYSTFHSEVKALVDSSFSSASEAEAEFMTDILILTNLAN